MKTKNEIVDRLYKAGHITLEEVLVLMEKDYIQTVNVPTQWYRPYEVYCGTSVTSKTDTPFTYIIDNNPKIGENSCLRPEENTSAEAISLNHLKNKITNGE